jgi:hypothetical protein
MRTELPFGGRSTGLVDVLDRVLDKGLLVAGDIRVSLAGVELLTIRIRLVICSMDKAQEMGLDWWKHDDYFAPGRQRLTMENQALRRQVRELERRVAALHSARRTPARAQGARSRRREQRVASPENRGD